jgi:hypothetical protein
MYSCVCIRRKKVVTPTASDKESLCMIPIHGMSICIPTYVYTSTKIHIYLDTPHSWKCVQHTRAFVYAKSRFKKQTQLHETDANYAPPVARAVAIAVAFTRNRKKNYAPPVALAVAVAVAHTRHRQTICLVTGRSRSRSVYKRDTQNMPRP